jgi:uncharacterized membrane protein YbhN (UPF0104 family)
MAVATRRRGRGRASPGRRDRRRARRLLVASKTAAVLLAIMLLGSLALWVGVPVAWLWIGSQIQAETDSLGAALGAMMLGMVLSIAALVSLLTWLNGLHIELQAARGREIRGATALEQILVGSAALAVVAFVVWFFGFSGSEPIPFKISY